MKLRRMLPPLVIALVVSGLCTLLLSRKLTHTVEKVPLEHYAALSHALAAGEAIRPDNVQMISWPATSPVSGAFARADAVVGRSVLYPTEPGQPLTEHLVSAAGAGPGLAGRIPDGMRAIALKSDEVMGVAGFLLPGSHLDMLVTYRSERSPEPVTVTVLQDVEMLAAGHDMQPDPAGKPAPVDVVTLLLTPADAERAVLASTQGAIHFVLRSGSDGGHTHDEGVALSQLSGLAPASAATTPMLSAASFLAGPGRFGPITPLPLAAAPAAAPSAAAGQAAAPAPAGSAPPRASAHQQVVQTISGDKQVFATFDEAGR